MVATSDPLAAQAGLEHPAARRQRDRRGRRHGRGAGRHLARTTPASAATCSPSSTSRRTRSCTPSTRAVGRPPAGRLSSSPNSRLRRGGRGGGRGAPDNGTGRGALGNGSGRGVPGNGVNSATVPGAISGYDALLKRFGTRRVQRDVRGAPRSSPSRDGELAERRHSGSEERHQRPAQRLRTRSETLSRQRRDAGALQRHSQSGAGLPRCASSRRKGRDAFYKGDIADRDRRPRCRRTAA